MTILTVNAGSSSVRLALFDAGGGALRPLLRARLEGDRLRPRDELRAFLAERARPDAIAHRIVHGGAKLTRPCAIDRAVEDEIARAAALAPLHNPRALEWIAAARELLPGVRQIAAFDTAFFAELPDAAASYALPRALCREFGIRRWGFHGLAHQSMWRAWLAQNRERPNARVISFQLGAGCSAAAIAGGRPLDTSMGFTPLEGLVMATRSGDLDPGIIFHLLRERAVTLDGLERLLEARSGLAGVSGSSGDLGALLASTSDDARLAVELYVHRARKYLGAYLAVLGGADAVLFGGGVGEHLPEARARIASRLEWCGVQLDAERNARASGTARISADGSRVEAWVIAVDEEAVLAGEALALGGRS
ncbi:MAG TPA: acetate/propionate family kinase [Polyangia bacterium]|nr:acetate/propionate family kinase [Polyangia bacterium]